MASDVITIEYSPLPKQREFHESDKRWIAFVAGVGGGKSLALCADILKDALKYPGSVYMITAPTYPMLRDSTMVSWRKLLPKGLAVEYKGEKKFVFINGSEVWFRSSNDPESLRGPNITGFGMDEAAKDKRKTWDILVGRCRLVTRAPDGSIAPNKGRVSTTPKGFNWVYETFAKNTNPDTKVVYASSKDNPYLPEDFVRSLERTYTRTFYEQEVMGKFVAHEGVVYRDFSRDTHVVDFKSHLAGGKARAFYGCIDWGYSNPMVGLLAAADGDDRLTFCGEVYERRLQVEEFAHHLREQEKMVAKALDIAEPLEVVYYADPAEPAFIDKLRNMGFDVRSAVNDILPGIAAVSSRLAPNQDGGPRVFFDAEMTNTINELEVYSYDEFDGEKPQKDKPMKMNDHAMDAVRYLVMSLEGSGQVKLLDVGFL